MSERRIPIISVKHANGWVEDIQDDITVNQQDGYTEVRFENVSPLQNGDTLFLEWVRSTRLEGREG